MAKPKILITGSAGYVGSALARMLIQKNFDVWLIDNYSTPSNITEVEGIEIEKKDIRDANLDLSDIDVLFHLAAISGIKKCDENETETFSVNVKGTYNLLRSKFRGKIIFPSTSAVYGVCQYSPIDEKHPIEPRCLYGQTKIGAENLIKLNDRFVVLRFSNIYGRGIFNKRTVTDGFIDRAVSKKPLEIHGDGRQRRDFVHINDTLVAYWNSMRNESHGIYNIGGNQALSVNDIAELVIKSYRQVFGYTLDVQYVPTDCGIEWKDFEYSSKKARDGLTYEPSYSISDEIRGRLLISKRKRNSH